MDMPPTRFRVVERGRRLEVIDTASGKPIGGKPRPAPVVPPDGTGRENTPLMLDQVVGHAPRPHAGSTRPDGLPRTTRFDGSVSFTTRAFYDDRAPRTVMLDSKRSTLLRWAAFSCLLLLIVTPALLIMLAWSSLPLLFAIGAIAFNPKVRERLRAGITFLIDRYADPA